MPHAMRLPAAAVAVTLATVGAFATAMSTPDSTISRSFATALDSRPAAVLNAADDTAFNPAHLHLSSLPMMDAAVVTSAMAGPFMAGVSVGDHLSLADRNSAVRSYRITAVVPLSRQHSDGLDSEGLDRESRAENLGHQAGRHLARLLLVTAMPIDGDRGARVRFIVDVADPSKQADAAIKPRSL